jgi:hypothetical protein
MNSREKGKRGERQWRDELRANGYAARRGQQFSGSAESPDVVCESLPWIHFEVKAVERLNIEEAMEQARRDARVEGRRSNVDGRSGAEVRRGCAAPESGKREIGKSENGKVPVVAHRRRFRAWLVTMEAETFFRFLRGDFTEANEGNEGPGGRAPVRISDFKGLNGPENNGNHQ